MLCVSSVNYTTLVNFEKVGPIHPGRGLRQGDPLSPYLFILVAEGLTSLINKAVKNGDLHGVKICRGALTVSHLLFADDCFYFAGLIFPKPGNYWRFLKLMRKHKANKLICQNRKCYLVETSARRCKRICQI
jgi:hypothetical protein